MTQITPWEVIPHTGVSELPKLLHEIVVKDFTLPLVGDHKGVVVAFVAGAYWDDPEARALAEQNAALIASAPALKAENERLRKEVERLKRQLRREQDYAAFLEDRHSNDEVRS